MARWRSWRLSSNCPHAGVEVPQPLLALGQLDFDLGGLAVGRQPAALQPLDLLAKPGQVRLHLGQRGLELLSLLPGSARRCSAASCCCSAS